MRARRVLAAVCRRLVRERRISTALEALFVAIGSWALLGLVLHGAGGRLVIALVVALAWLLTIGRWRDTRLEDPLELARALDARRPELEDSCELVLSPAESGSALVQLQRQRVASRLEAEGPRSLRAVLRGPALVPPAVALALALSGLLSLAWEPGSGPAAPAATLTGEERRAPHLTAGQIAVRPPTYTGLSAATMALDAEVPEGSVLEWELSFTSDPDAVTLEFGDGPVISLERRAPGQWVSPPVQARPALYRIIARPGETTGLPPGSSRLDVRADAPPGIEIVEPAEMLRSFPSHSRPEVAFRIAVTDDYGVGEAQALVTLARGSGENVRFRETARPMVAYPTTDRAAEFSLSLDVAALGMEAGDELYVFAQVSDNRPVPNVARSPTVILRWQGVSAAPASPLAGLALDVLPAYFRSQRQLILDTEALVAETPELAPEHIAGRAQALAEDQKLLRLRYGQFLGEEAVSAAARLPQDAPVADAEASPQDHEHDHPEAGRVSTGNAADVPSIESFVHMHDSAEHATLFDDETKNILKRALASMWEAELQLRLGLPGDALPHEYAALRALKRVQQRSRVHLRRAGFEPLPPREERRFTGETDGLPQRREIVTVADNEGQSLLLDLLDALDEPRALAAWSGSSRAEALWSWLRVSGVEAGEVLTLQAALAGFEQDTRCAHCRDAAAAWVIGRLPHASARPVQRERRAPAMGHAYSEALGRARE